MIYLGCADGATIFTMDLNDNNRDFIINLCNLTHTNKHPYTPTIDIFNYNDLIEPWDTEDEFACELKNRIPYGKELNKVKKEE